MANVATITKKINRGYGIAAAKLGPQCNWYRPSSAANPVSGNTLIGSISCNFDTKPSFKFDSPAQYGKPVQYALIDPTLLQVGDYLQDPSGRLYFIASIESLHPTMVVQCNRTISFSHDVQGTSGSAYYSGANLTTVQLLANWPISLLMTPKVESGSTKLPGDVSLPKLEFMMPAYPGVMIQHDDHAIDDAGVTYEVMSIENTALGWRGILQQTTT